MNPVTAGQAPLPPFDPLGLPAQASVLLGLAYLTLTLHLLAMTFTLGGALMLAWSLARRRARDAGVARFFGVALPLGFSYLITFGVPPLLFLQVVYGQFFYSSSVLVGAFWISVIPLLITAYGLAYVHKLAGRSRPRAQLAVVGGILLAMLGVAFIFVNNLTLSMAPQRWLALYVASPGGASLNLAEPTLWPRWLLVMSLAPAVAGLALLLRGSVLVGWGRMEEGRASKRLGRGALLAGVTLAVAAGAAFALRLPDEVKLALGRGHAMVLLLAAGVLALTAVLLGLLAARRRTLVLPVLAVVALTGALGALVALRDAVRWAYLEPYFDPFTAPVVAQPKMLALFATVLVAGLLFMVAVSVAVIRRIVAGNRGPSVSGPSTATPSLVGPPGSI